MTLYLLKTSKGLRKSALSLPAGVVHWMQITMSNTITMSSLLRKDLQLALNVKNRVQIYIKLRWVYIISFSFSLCPSSPHIWLKLCVFGVCSMFFLSFLSTLNFSQVPYAINSTFNSRYGKCEINYDHKSLFILIVKAAFNELCCRGCVRSRRTITHPCVQKIFLLVYINI